MENITALLKAISEIAQDTDNRHVYSSAESIMDRLKNQHLNLVVLGQFKRGKTTVINALLGEKVLPSAVIPLTSIVTKPIYSKDKGAEVIFKSVTKAEALKSINEPEAQARLRVLDLYREQIEGLSRRVL